MIREAAFYTIDKLIQWANPIETISFVERQDTTRSDQSPEQKTGLTRTFHYFKAVDGNPFGATLSKAQFHSYFILRTLSQADRTLAPNVPAKSDGSDPGGHSFVDKYRAINMKKAAVYAALVSSAIKLSNPHARWPNVIANACVISGALMAILGGSTGRRLAWIPFGYVGGKLGADLAMGALNK